MSAFLKNIPVKVLGGRCFISSYLIFKLPAVLGDGGRQPGGKPSCLPPPPPHRSLVLKCSSTLSKSILISFNKGKFKPPTIGDQLFMTMSIVSYCTSGAADVRTGTAVRKWGWLVIEGECWRIWEICEVSSNQLHIIATVLVFNLSSISCTSYCTLCVRHKGKC
jgi:hypothetical protein